MKFNYYMPTRLFFGCGELARLGSEKLPGKKALVVVSAGGSMEKQGYLERVTTLLKQNNATSVIYEKIRPNPTKQQVMNGAELCRNEACDFVVGLGGGSTIDAAKSIAVMANNPGDYWDYVAGGSGKAQPIPNQALPVIAITTTAGTGTEADPWTVVTDGQEKIGFGYDGTFPYFSIIDPELMATVPAKLTAYQGFDTLFHCAEGYIANVANPISDMFALKGVQLVHEYLARAVKNPNDMEARENLALANTLGGFVQSTSSCTSEHGIEHALSGRYPKLPHGAGLIMISQAYFQHFTGYVPGRFFSLAKAMGRGEASRAEAFVQELTALQRACGVDDLCMSDYGIKREELQEIAEEALRLAPGMFEKDRHPLSLAEVVLILKTSYR